MSDQSWPALPLSDWQDTYETPPLWTQIVGKIRMKLSPKLNHWWHSTLYVNTRGLTTSPIPYGGDAFEMQFDFLDHRLDIMIGAGRRASVALVPLPVAEFYTKVMSALGSLGI